MKMFINYFLGIYADPLKALTALKKDPRKLLYAFGAIAVHFVFAGGKQLYYYFTRHPVSPAYWLALPADNVWLFSFIFLLPTIIVQCVVFAGMVTLLAGLFKGKGTFVGQFAAYALAYIPVIVIFIAAALIGFLLKINGNVFFKIFYWALLAWDMAVVILSVRVEQGLKWAPAVVCGMAGFACAFVISFTYVR